MLAPTTPPPHRTAPHACRNVLLPALTQLRQRTTLYPATSTSAPLPSTAAAAAAAMPTAPAAFSGSGGGVQPAPGMLMLGPGMEPVPAMFVCPITQDVMEEPVVAADGYTYERDAIQEW